jgi:tetratricopeptide (TPR) repeat protein
LFENRLSLEHLDPSAAREAITKPIAQFNLVRPSEAAISIEPQLVDTILQQVKTGQVVLGQAGRGVVEGEQDESASTTEIETPFLQMVLTRLWEEEMRVDSRVLRLETLERLGGAAQIVRTHLDNTMTTLSPKDQDIASRIFYHLVTPSGTKIAHTVPDLAAFAKLSPSELNPVLSRLSDNNERILRPVDPPPSLAHVERYEIFHDVLAPAILDWRVRYFQEQEQAAVTRESDEHRQRAEDQAQIVRRLRWVTGALVIVCLVAIAAALYASRQKIQAQQNQKKLTMALETAKNEAVQRQKAEETLAAATLLSAVFKQESTILKTDREADDLEIQHVHDLQGGAVAKFKGLLDLYVDAEGSIEAQAKNGVADAKDLFDEYRLGEANTYLNLGRIYEEEQKHRDSLTYFDKALAKKQEVLGPDHQDLAPILVAQANSHYLLGNYGNASKAIAAAIGIYTRHGFKGNKSPLKDAVDLQTNIETMNR